MELFVFGEDRSYRVAGIDENAFGPIIGPMTVSGVVLQVPDDPILYLDMRNMALPRGLADSKKVFTRSKTSYSLGEITALSIVQLAHGRPVSTIGELIDLIVDGGMSRIMASPLLSSLDYDVKLPIWAKFVDETPLREWLTGMDIELVDVKVEVISSTEFNEMLKTLSSKLQLDFIKFFKVMERLSDFDVAMCGKIGGTKYYLPLFNLIGLDAEKVKESRNASVYRLQNGREVHFILDGDSKFLPIAMASIVGKYMRELFMHLINARFGYESDIPWASGYRHDSKTYELLERMKAEYPQSDVERRK